MMQNQLNFSLELKSDPLAGSLAVRLEAWGLLKVNLVVPNGQVTLLELEWNLDTLAEWYAEYQDAICYEVLPVTICTPKSNESLAQAWYRCFFEDIRGSDDINEESEHDFQRRVKLQEYATRHFISTGLLGTTVPPIVIGLNRGVGEISLCIKEGDYICEGPDDPMYSQEWAFTFNMVDFRRNSHESMSQFLTSWLASSNDPLIHERANLLISQLHG